MYTYIDQKSKRADTPFFCHNDINAERKFIMDIRNKETIVSQFKDDFTLIRVGFFDIEKGTFIEEEEVIREGIQIDSGEEK